MRVKRVVAVIMAAAMSLCVFAAPASKLQTEAAPDYSKNWNDVRVYTANYSKTFSNVSITMDKFGKPGTPAMMGQLPLTSAAGFFMRNARKIVFDNVSIENVNGVQIDVDDSVELKQ